MARDLLLSARAFDAAEAQRIGLLSRVVPHDDLRAAAIEAARQVLRTAPAARVQVKRMLNERYGLIDYETMFWGSSTRTSVARECARLWRSGRRAGFRRTDASLSSHRCLFHTLAWAYKGALAYRARFTA
jgi:enoyl-CoA hydratase